MKVMTGTEMAAFDNHCINRLMVPGFLLMEHAGHLIAKGALDLLSGSSRSSSCPTSQAQSHRFLVICGGGNNGGDGLVAARHLRRWGHKVSVVLLKEPNTFTEDSLLNYNLLLSVVGVEPTMLDMSSLDKKIAQADVVIDAMFGTGLTGPLREPVRKIVTALNTSITPVVAADIPSGLSADDGTVPPGDDGQQVAVQAERTVTMGLPKLGFFGPEAKKFTGKIVVADIGFPQKALIEGVKGRKSVDLMVGGRARKVLKRRPDGGHKGTFGRVMVVGGSLGMAGAVAMAAGAALKAGAGLVSIGVPASIQREVSVMVPEATTFPLPDTSGTLTKEAIPYITNSAFRPDVILIGPGLGRSKGSLDFVHEIIAGLAVPLILDADALYCPKLSMQTKFRSAPTFLTPHEGEARQILSGIQCDNPDFSDTITARLRRATLISRNCAAQAVLKGEHTVIADNDGNVTINTTGNSGMATGGSGDVLAGVLAALVAFETAAENSADAGTSVSAERWREVSALATYIHGLAGDIAADKLSSHSVTAISIKDSLSEAFKNVLSLKADDSPYCPTLKWDGLWVIS